MAVSIRAAELRIGDVVNLGGRAYAGGIEREGLIVIALVPELGGWYRFSPDHRCRSCPVPTPTMWTALTDTDTPLSTPTRAQRAWRSIV